MPEESIEAEMYRNFSSYRQMKFIGIVFPPILLIIGSFGNTMVPIVLYKHSRVVSTYTYLISLAIADQTVLMVGVTEKWIFRMFGLKLDSISNISCKSIAFLGSTSSQIAVWLIVVVTVERMIVVSMPFKVPQHITVARARFCVFCVIASFLLINCHFLFTVKIMVHDESSSDNISTNSSLLNFSSVIKICYFKQEFELAVIWSGFDAIIYCYLPCLIIIIANVVIIHFLRTAHKRRLLMQCKPTTFNCQSTPKNQTKQVTYQLKSSNQSNQQLLMLILVSWVFVLTVLPVSIFKIVIAIINKYNPDYFKDQKTNSEFLLINEIVEILMNANHSINFFLYCIAGKKFRNYFLALFKCSRHRKSNSSIIVGVSMYGNSNCSRRFIRKQDDDNNDCVEIVKPDNCREVLIECCTEL